MNKIVAVVVMMTAAAAMLGAIHAMSADTQSTDNFTLGHLRR